MKKIKIFRCAVPYVSILILLIFDVILLFSAIRAQILPTKYFVALTASVSVITFLIAFLLFSDKIRHKKGKSIFKKVTVYVLAVILGAISLTGSSIFFKFKNTLDAITSNEVTESLI